MKTMFQAVLFDLDGVLVDSGPIADRHWRRWAAAHGIDFSRIEEVHHGRPSRETIRLVAPHLDADIEGPKRELDEAADVEGLIAFPRAEELLGQIPPDRWAVVTSSRRKTALARISHAGLPMPQVIVTADDVYNGKPAADPYCLAAHLLNFSCAECLVIEDALSGIRSAKAAGATAVAIAQTAMDGADLTISRLADMDIESVVDGLRVSFPPGIRFNTRSFS
jgi:sugar-phosphatase